MRRTTIREGKRRHGANGSATIFRRQGGPGDIMVELMHVRGGTRMVYVNAVCAPPEQTMYLCSTMNLSECPRNSTSDRDWRTLTLVRPDHLQRFALRRSHGMGRAFEAAPRRNRFSD